MFDRMMLVRRVPVRVKVNDSSVMLVDVNVNSLPSKAKEQISAENRQHDANSAVEPRAHWQRESETE